MDKDFFDKLPDEHQNILVRPLGQYLLFNCLLNSLDIRGELDKLVKIETSNYTDAVNAVHGFLVDSGVLQWERNEDGSIKLDKLGQFVAKSEQFDALQALLVIENLASAIGQVAIKMFRSTDAGAATVLRILGESAALAASEHGKHEMRSDPFGSLLESLGGR